MVIMKLEIFPAHLQQFALPHGCFDRQLNQSQHCRVAACLERNDQAGFLSFLQAPFATLAWRGGGNISDRVSYTYSH